MNGNVDKETFLAGVVCLTKGWYVHHHADEAPTRGLRWRFHAGSDVAKQARDWLGSGRMIRSAPLQDALDSTADALRNPDSELLFEATFRSSRCVARADALRREKDGWNLLEIKSGITPAQKGDVKDEYIDDIAYTGWVASSTGLQITKLILVLVNREYRLGGNTPMFVEVDVTEPARARIAEFKVRSAAVVAAATQTDRPTPSLQFVCKDCDFFTTECVGVDVNDPLFSIPRLSERQFVELRDYGRVSRLPNSVKLTDNQQRMIEVCRSGDIKIDADGLGLLDEVKLPVYYLDFEAVSPHIPWFADRPPYDATPFQYSLHIRTALGIAIEHRSYLAPATGDWRKEITTSLLADLETSGSIVVYSSYEKTRLSALAKLFPELSNQIDEVIKRLFDLEAVVKRGYVHPGFEGRTSIKKVLPVLAPDLSYEGLEVGNGDDASASFALMRVGVTPEDEQPSERAALEAYCLQDTLAMVRIHDRLEQERAKLL